LRLTALPADSLANARNTLTQKLWDSAGSVDVKLDASGLSDGQRAGFTFITGNKFGWVGVLQKAGQRHIAWEGNDDGPILSGDSVYLRGTYDGPAARLWYSTDGRTYTDAGQHFTLGFLFWKGARVGLFSYGPGNGTADFDYFHYRYADATTN
jgi:hypothetical protein